MALAVTSGVRKASSSVMVDTFTSSWKLKKSEHRNAESIKTMRECVVGLVRTKLTKLTAMDTRGSVPTLRHC